MAPRLNKRQQRELEELDALRPSKLEEPTESDSDGDDVNPKSGARASAGFSALLVEENLPESEEDQAPAKSAKKSKKKKKKAKSESNQAVPPAPVSSQSKSEKKAGKKARAKEKKTEKDELDQALADLSLKYPDLQQLAPSSGPTPSVSARSLASLLSVSTPNLDAEAEMRRFFGSKVVQASKAASASPASRRTGAVSRSTLTRPQPSWWPAKLREGLSTRVLTDSEWSSRAARHQWDAHTQEKWWTVEYSKKYKNVTLAFMRTVMSGDPEGFWNLLRHLPWHADTLLQLAEVYRHREEYAQAVDFVDRALFTYERSFVGAFSFTNGMNRLDFDYVETRPFFLAVHRQVTDLQRRGCVRTAFEFARLLLSLDPWEDPHGALFHVDFLSIKSGMGGWLLDMYDLHAANDGDETNSRLNPKILPGWAYARALALHSDEDARKDTVHEASTAALREAIRTFPSIVPLLADKIEVSLPASIRGHPDFRIQTDGSSLSPEDSVLHLLSHVYVQRSFSLWKDAKVSQWFSDTAVDEFATLPSSLPKQRAYHRFLKMYSNKTLRYSVYRHILVLEATHKRFFPFLPRDVLTSKSLACDPLPPPTAVTEYGNDFFAGSDDIFSLRRTRQQRAADERRLERMIPDAAFRQQLQAFFEANPNIAEQFPGGILQFAQNAARLPPDVLEAMMVAELVNAPGNGGMPGQMPDMPDLLGDDEDALGGQGNARNPEAADQIEDDDAEMDQDEEEEGSEEEDIPPMAIRVLRNIVGRFWGGNAGNEDDSDDEDNSETELIDRDGVD